MSQRRDRKGKFVKTVVRTHDRSQAFFDKARTDIEKLVHKTAFRVAIGAAKSMKHDSTSVAVKNRDDRGKFLKDTTRKVGKGESNPSKPGTPPGVKTGLLRGSLDVESFRDGTNTFVARAGTNLEYGRAHELGSPSRNLPARPFLRPAFHKEGLRENGYRVGSPFGKRLAAILKKASGG
jgi:phage gpG-like protein